MSGRFAGGASAPKAGGVTVSSPETRNGCGRGRRGIFCGVCALAATPILCAFRTFVYLSFFCLYIPFPFHLYLNRSWVFNQNCFSMPFVWVSNRGS
jgi:hypothetical protein